jgi:hypothetical protein
VAFDGQWQEDFQTLPEALKWAEEVSQTGRTTYVIEWRGFLRGHLFRTSFPQEGAREAEQAWLYWQKRGWQGGSGG